MQEAAGSGIPASGIAPLTPPPASRLVLHQEDKVTKILLGKQDPPYPLLCPSDGIPLNIPGRFPAWGTTHWHCFSIALLSAGPHLHGTTRTLQKPHTGPHCWGQPRCRCSFKFPCLCLLIPSPLASWSPLPHPNLQWLFPDEPIFTPCVCKVPCSFIQGLNASFPFLIKTFQGTNHTSPTQVPKRGAGEAHQGGVHPCRLRLELRVIRILTINRKPHPPQNWELP